MKKQLLILSTIFTLALAFALPAEARPHSKRGKRNTVQKTYRVKKSYRSQRFRHRQRYTVRTNNRWHKRFRRHHVRKALRPFVIYRNGRRVVIYR